MYVDIFSPLTKAISIMFERVTITSTCYHMHYHTSSISLEWFGAICNALPRVTVEFTKKYILKLKKERLRVVTRCK